MENRGTGLVLEGGGVRGIYTAGVLDVFMEESLTFDGVIGVSAGAIHACSYLSGQKGRSIRYYRKYVRDPRFMSFRSWLTTGDIVGAQFCYHDLPDRLDVYDHEAFLRNPTPYYAVVTDVDTGRPEYVRLRDMRGQIEYLRASASLPYFSRIVELDGTGIWTAAARIPSRWRPSAGWAMDGMSWCSPGTRRTASRRS